MEASSSANEISCANSALAFSAEEESFKLMIDSLLEMSKRHLHGKRIIESCANSVLVFPTEEKSFKLMIDSLSEQSKSKRHLQEEQSKSKRHLQEKCIIERVPQLLRNSASNNKDYNPMMVSIGPYHHGKKELQRAEKVKPTMAKLFVSSSDRTLHEFYKAILSEVNDLKSYYVKDSADKYSDEEFASMMLLDGCLVLAIIECITFLDVDVSLRYRDELMCLGTHSFVCFTCDTICLMENQLPFQVLRLLMSLKYKGNDEMKMMNAFLDVGVHGDVEPGREIKVDVGSILEQRQPVHLLELRCLAFYGPISQREKRRSKSREKYKASELLYFFRSVSELKAKGIYIRCSGSHLVTSIKFRSFFFFGLLDLPIVQTSPLSRIGFSNLIAYELTLGDYNMCLLTSFTNFMKSLVNHPDDVKELRSKHVLISEQYSSDEEVVNIMNSITTYPTGINDKYEEVKEMIQKHCNSKAKTWMAELIHSYFSSPWAFMAFMAAILVVGLTCIQTYFTVFPRPGSRN